MAKGKVIANKSSKGDVNENDEDMQKSVGHLKRKTKAQGLKKKRLYVMKK